MRRHHPPSVAAAEGLTLCSAQCRRTWSSMSAMGGGAGRGAEAPFAGGRNSDLPTPEGSSAEGTVPETWGVAACGFGFVGGSTACAIWHRTRAAVASPNTISPHRASARRVGQGPRAPRNATIPCVIAIRPNCSSYLPGRSCVAAVGNPATTLDGSQSFTWPDPESHRASGATAREKN